jgi:hypothetical protein
MLLQQHEKVSTLQTSLDAFGAHLESTVTNIGEQVIETVNDLVNKSIRDTVLKWYKSCDPEQNHRLSREKHDADICNWIFDTREFQSWSTNEGESMWLHGIPGASKTILCSTIINHMQGICLGKAGVRVVYFYFDFSDNTKQSVPNFLKSIIF